MASIETPSAHKVPAWKKLGLKLKSSPAATGSSNASPVVGPVGHPSSSVHASQSSQSSHKRRLDPPASDASPANKRPRNDYLPKTPRKVTFGDTPSKNDKSVAAAKPIQPKREKVKGPAKKKTQPIFDFNPALDYLRQWKTSRENWKFNKNHQVSLIKYIFDPKTFPVTDVDAFYEYIRDLKGFTRTRLQETAMDIRMRDESDGYAAFPEDTMDLDEKQNSYESILADILRRRSNGKRKFFIESEYTTESQDGDLIIHRVVKRMRAEMVLDELSDGESTDTTSTSASSKTVTASDNAATTRTDTEKPVKLTDGPAKRRRKLRTQMDDSSSSESESDSDSDTSSNSSSDDSDSDEEDEGRANNIYDTSSSSSSSSSESDSEDESDED